MYGYTALIVINKFFDVDISNRAAVYMLLSYYIRRESLGENEYSNLCYAHTSVEIWNSDSL